MRFDTLLKTPATWTKDVGLESEIVITSRIRLARNIANHPFPGWATKEQNRSTLNRIRPCVELLETMSSSFSSELSKLTPIQKQLLVERHLISREHAARSLGSATVMNREQSLSIMINEEDHLRMQAIRSGLALTDAYSAINAIDSELEQSLDWAFHSQLGYLTACPTNLGTGMRASAMLHLPGLVLSEQVNQVIQAVNKIGLAVRGLYGEGTEALGNLFQVSNQTTLGDKEPEIIARLQRVVEQIVGHERNARLKLLEDKEMILCDQIGRAYALLRFSHIMPSKEALNLLSHLRLGIDLGFFAAENRALIDSLFMEIQPAHLQIHAGRKLPTSERDTLRSEIMRARLKTFSEPDINNALGLSRLKPESEQLSNDE